jgi:serine/alanine adding enzyme
MQVSHVEDRREWDDRLRARGGHPLQSWAWGALKADFGWQAHRLVADDALALLLLRPYRGLSAAYVPRGPLFSGSAAADTALLAELVSISRHNRAAFLRLEPDLALGSDGQAQLEVRLDDRFRQVERTLQPRSSIRLDIRPAEDQLFAGLSKGHRADVRRAERNGVRVRVGSGDGDVEALHQMMRETQRRKEFGIHTAGYFRRLKEHFGDDGRLLLAEHDGQLVAATLAIAFGAQALYLAAGTSPAGLQLRASHLLQWHAIRWARQHGATSYDLWGIPDARGRLALATEIDGSESARAKLEDAAAKDPLDGVYRFKKGWGGQVVRSVPAYDRVFLAPAYWFWLWRRSEA